MTTLVRSRSENNYTSDGIDKAKKNDLNKKCIRCSKIVQDLRQLLLVKRGGDYNHYIQKTHGKVHEDSSFKKGVLNAVFIVGTTMAMFWLVGFDL